MLRILFSVFISVFLGLLPCIASATIPSVSEQATPSISGYDCGKTFFTDEIVQAALLLAFSRPEQAAILPYNGPLFHKAFDYKVLPILEDGSSPGSRYYPHRHLWPEANFQVVFGKDGKVIDMIVKMTNGGFTKCWRVDSLLPESAIYTVEGSNGYLCGDKFISDQIIESSHAVARKALAEGASNPSFHKLNSHGEGSQLMNWPIYKCIEFYPSPKSVKGPYFMVIDSSGQMRNVVVRIMNNGYIRCMRSKQIQQKSTFDENCPNIFAQPPKLGFMCNSIFFNAKDLQIASERAKSVKTTSSRNKFPLLHRGPPFDFPCFLWPIKPTGEKHGVGNHGKYRLVMTLDFKVVGVSIQRRNDIKRCEEENIAGGRQAHDMHDYRCGSHSFSHNELIAAAAKACKRRNIPRFSFPARYEGPDFEIEGPYLTFPILKGKEFRSRPGPHRMVMNTNCKVVGAITNNYFSSKWSRCKIADTSESSANASEGVEGVENEEIKEIFSPEKSVTRGKRQKNKYLGNLNSYQRSSVVQRI